MRTCSLLGRSQDLAGSEAPHQNANATATAQGIKINQSLHWLRVAVHELAERRPPQLRNSLLTRLLTPSLAGGAHVVLVVCAPARPPSAAARDAMDALAFGVTAGRVQLRVKRRTEVEGGQIGKLQALLVQLADEKSALAEDASVLRDKLEGYEDLIGSMRGTLVSKESLAAAKEMAEAAEAELQSAKERNAELQRRCAEEEATSSRLASQLAAVEAAAVEASQRNANLLEATRSVSEEREALEARLSAARASLSEQEQMANEREAQLEAERDAVGELRRQLDLLQQQLSSERETAAAREEDAAALAETNHALQASVSRAREEVKAKNDLLLLKHRMYVSRRRPSTSCGAPSGAPPSVRASMNDDLAREHVLPRQATADPATRRPSHVEANVPTPLAREMRPTMGEAGIEVGAGQRMPLPAHPSPQQRVSARGAQMSPPSPDVWRNEQLGSEPPSPCASASASPRVARLSPAEMHRLAQAQVPSGPRPPPWRSPEDM